MFVLKMQLLLNDRCELDDICRAATREDLERVISESSCEPYDDPVTADWKGPPLAPGVHAIRKYFKKGSILEWCAPPGPRDRCIVPVGSEKEWVKLARESWQKQVFHFAATMAHTCRMAIRLLRQL